MKKYLFVFISLSSLCFVTNANAQENEVLSSSESDEEILVFDDASDDVLELDAVDVMDSAESEVRNGARPLFAQTITSPDLQSINDWLESANGVYGDASGKGTRSVIVRGFETRQLDVLFAGMPLDTGFNGMTGLDVLPMNWISAGRISHADATPTDGVGFGGKIDLYAFEPSKMEASVEISRNGVIGAVSHGYHEGPWRWAATVGGQYSNGIYLSHAFEPCADEDGGLRDASDKQGLNFLVKAGRSLGSWGDIEVLTGWANAPRSVPTGLETGTNRFWRYTSWRVAFAMAKLRFETSVLNGQLYFWANDQGNTLETYDDASRTTQKSKSALSSVWQDDDYGMRLDLNGMPINLGKAGFMSLLLRTDFRYQLHASHDKTFVPVAENDEDSSRLRYDVRPAIEWAFRSDMSMFVAGNAAGVVPVSQSDTNKTDLSVKLTEVHDGGFSVGYDYSILDNLEFNLRAARRLRLPSLKEQFRDVPETVALSGDEISDLHPEKAWDFEAEIHWKPIDEVALTVGLFDTEIRDLIDFKYINNIKISYNVNEARLAGTDIALKLGSWAGVSFDLSYHYLYAYDLSDGHELNDRPTHNLRGAIHYAPVEPLRLTLAAQFESKRRTEAWLTSKTVWMGNVFLISAEIEYHIQHFSMYLRGTNLTDYNYSRAYGYPEPGFNIMLGAKVVY